MENTVNERLKLLRSELKLSQSELAAKLGMSSTGIWKIETEGAKPRSSTLSAIAREFNVSLEWLMYGTGEMFSAPKTEAQPQSWKDAAFEAMREQIEILKNQNRFMQELIIQKLGVNFNFGVADLVGITDIHIVSDSCNTVRVANLAA